MDKKQIIQHAKSYLDMLTNGTDPIRKKRFDEDSVVSQPQMQMCFAYISGILQELLDHNGYVALPDENGSTYELVRKKESFHLSLEQKWQISISPAGTSPSGFLKNVNNLVNDHTMEKLTAKAVNSWLQNNGYISAAKAPTVINRTVWLPTGKAKDLGFTETACADPVTGEVKRQMVYSQQAQEFLIEHLDEIAAGK